MYKAEGEHFLPSLSIRPLEVITVSGLAGSWRTCSDPHTSARVLHVCWVFAGYGPNLSSRAAHTEGTHSCTKGVFLSPPPGEHHRLRGVRPVQLIPDHNPCHTLGGHGGPSAGGKGGR